MSIKEYLAGAKQAGTVQKLMTPGLAVEFIQPWYTPLSTTPSTTGIAVGGIGSTFTATPAGTTPVMNVMPGVQVRTEKPSDLRFNNFFFKEAVLSAKASLVIGNFAAFGIYNNNFPLLDANGARVFGEADMKDQKKAEANLNKALADKTLFDTMDCSLPGSSIHGILQARILEWVPILFSRGSSQPRDQSQVS